MACELDGKEQRNRVRFKQPRCLHAYFFFGFFHSLWQSLPPSLCLFLSHIRLNVGCACYNFKPNINRSTANQSVANLQWNNKTALLLYLCAIIGFRYLSFINFMHAFSFVLRMIIWTLNIWNTHIVHRSCIFMSEKWLAAENIILHEFICCRLFRPFQKIPLVQTSSIFKKKII